MKLLMQIAAALTLTGWASGALANEIYWGSIYTDLEKDCVIVAASNQKAEVDFAKRECKGFGGFQLYIEGADLRYSPALEFHGKTIWSHRERAFHDMGSQKVQWVYVAEQEADGNGHLQWMGFIYRLNVAREDGGKDDSKLFVIRLNGNKSCSLGEAKDNEAAVAMVKNTNLPCVEFQGKK